MRPRTALAALVCCGALLGVVAAGVTAEGGALTQTWVSDTARDNEVNHHAVGVGPRGEVLVAPTAAVSSDAAEGPNACSLARLRPSDGAIRWRWGVGVENCSTHALTQPAVADVDGDDALEVAAGTTEGAVVVLDAASGTEEWRVPLPTYGYGQPAVGNVTGDASVELVTSGISGGLVVADGDGTVAWRRALNMTVWARPRLADVDGDGAPEVVVGGDEGVVVYEGDGTRRWRADADATTLAVAPDGTVLAGTTGRLVALDGATGERRWGRNTSGTPRLHEVGDADGDGRTEAYAGLAGNTVLAVDTASGKTEWRTSLGGGERQTAYAPVLADVDGTGAPDVVAVANDGTVAVLDGETGEERAAYERSVPIWTYTTPADIDDDGAAEILVRYGDGRVVALEWVTAGSALSTVG